MLQREHAIRSAPQIGWYLRADITFGRRNTASGQPQRASHVARVVGREKLEDVGHLFWRSPPTKRNHGVDSQLFGLADRTVGASGPRRIDRTRADAIGAYAVRRLLQGNALHEGMKEALASAVGGEPWGTVQSGFRTGEDDIAPARPQMRQGELCHQKC